MLTFNIAWDTEAEAAILRLARDGYAAVKNPFLYRATADTVAACRDPYDPRKRLTTDALKAWEVACRTAPSEEPHHVNEDRPTRTIAPNSVLPDAA